MKKQTLIIFKGWDEAKPFATLNGKKIPLREANRLAKELSKEKAEVLLYTATVYKK